MRNKQMRKGTSLWAKRVLGVAISAGIVLQSMSGVAFAMEEDTEPDGMPTQEVTTEPVFEEHVQDDVADLGMDEPIEVGNSEDYTIADGANIRYPSKPEIAEYLKTHPTDAATNAAYEQEALLSPPYAPGKLSASYLNGALAVLNTYRYIAGIPANVTLDAEYTLLCQTGSLVNAANGQLSHSPSQPNGMSQEMYERGRRGCGRSNLAWGYSNLNSAIRNGWMADDDDGNIPMVGHRRWILNPSMSKTGFGHVSRFTSMYSFDTENRQQAAGYSGVAWPARYMPLGYFAESYPWTISMGVPVDINSVQVTLTYVNAGKTYHFSAAGADGYFNVNNGGYGQSGCIIFRPLDGTRCGEMDQYIVTVTGRYTDNTSFSMEHKVEFFEPSKVVPVVDTDKVQAFITRLYQKCLNRKPDAAGLQYWTDALKNGDKTGIEAAGNFVFSKEYLDKNVSDDEYITMLYNVFMDRAPDQGGFNHWKDLMQNGLSRKHIFRGFAMSKEYTDICNRYGIKRGDYQCKEPRDINANMTKFVARLYRQAMARSWDVEGLNYWCDMMQRGKMTPIQVSQCFIDSKEFKDKKLSDEEYVKTLYLTFMGRKYDKAGLKYWTDLLASGTSRRTVLIRFANCEEFKKIQKSFGL